MWGHQFAKSRNFDFFTSALVKQSTLNVTQFFLIVWFIDGPGFVGVAQW